MPKVAIFAPFQGLADTYSLSHVVRGQVLALQRRGIEVELWMLSDWNPNDFPLTEGIKDTIRANTVPHEFKPDQVTDASGEYAIALQANLSRFQPDYVITHDAMFQAAYIDFAHAIHRVATQTNAAWLHWVHSAIGAASGTLGDDSRWRTSLPSGHYIVYPNKCAREEVAVHFNTSLESVLYAPNTHDLTLTLSPTAQKILQACPLHDADFSQVYPLCATRMDAKNLIVVGAVMQAMVMQGHRVQLLVPAANANAEHEKEMILTMKRRFPRLPIVFSNDLGFEHGLPHSVIRELMPFTNMFLFPSKAEACPLVLIEAMQCGITVIANDNVPAIVENSPDGCLRFQFGNLVEDVTYETVITEPHVNDDGDVVERRTVLSATQSRAAFYSQVAEKIVERVADSDRERSRRKARQFNAIRTGEHLTAIMARARVPAPISEKSGTAVLST